jgi:3-phenylpropionate/trans-cinnamate dioxygenase ferredoxin reductase component
MTAGIRIIPNIELALDAGLQIGTGIVVDEDPRTSQLELSAAGDAADAN